MARQLGFRSLVGLLGPSMAILLRATRTLHPTTRPSSLSVLGSIQSRIDPRQPRVPRYLQLARYHFRLGVEPRTPRRGLLSAGNLLKSRGVPPFLIRAAIITAPAAPAEMIFHELLPRQTHSRPPPSTDHPACWRHGSVAVQAVGAPRTACARPHPFFTLPRGDGVLKSNRRPRRHAEHLDAPAAPTTHRSCRPPSNLILTIIIFQILQTLPLANSASADAACAC